MYLTMMRCVVTRVHPVATRVQRHGVTSQCVAVHSGCRGAGGPSHAAVHHVGLWSEPQRAFVHVVDACSHAPTVALTAPAHTHAHTQLLSFWGSGLKLLNGMLTHDPAKVCPARAVSCATRAVVLQCRTLDCRARTPPSSVRALRGVCRTTGGVRWRWLFPGAAAWRTREWHTHRSAPDCAPCAGHQPGVAAAASTGGTLLWACPVCTCPTAHEHAHMSLTRGLRGERAAVPACRLCAARCWMP